MFWKDRRRVASNSSTLAQDCKRDHSGRLQGSTSLFQGTLVNLVVDIFANREGYNTKRPDPMPIFNKAFLESILLKLPTNGVLHG